MTAPIDPIREALPVVIYWNSKTEQFAPMHEGGRPFARAFEPLCRLADVEKVIKALKADADRRALTAEQRTDLFAAALYISARGDDTAVLSGENAERIADLLCDLSGFDLDAALKEPS